ncbi:hypothetical protein Bbelb_054220 [Branchiostoma belcheri]|nr:hypothetical protein Bbelb_054220 [Branchiostoma belcheri]
MAKMVCNITCFVLCIHGVETLMLANLFQKDPPGTSDRAACDCDREAVLCFDRHAYEAVPSIKPLSEETCLQYAVDGNCDFYARCLEVKYRCGAKGYPVGFGHRYCTRFHTFYDYFNDEGKAWVDDTRKCLTTALLPVYKSNSSFDCDELKAFAFASHPTCYTTSGQGFCKVFWTNMRGLLKVFEVCDFLGTGSILMIEKILMTGLQCFCDHTMSDGIHYVLNATSEVRNKALEEIQDECQDKAVQGDCDFYNCLERRHPCGSKGFALQEGRPFCEELKIKKELFDAQGQDFVTVFTKCMTRSLLPEYRNDSISCIHIKNLGYRAQDNCFVEAGICDLVESSKNVFALWYISDVVGDSRSRLQLFTILCRC